MAEVRAIRLNDVQELGDHCCHTSEEPRSRTALRQVVKTHWVDVYSVAAGKLEVPTSQEMKRVRVKKEAPQR